MTAQNTSRPRFTRAYIDSIGKSFDERGFWALVPAWLIGCGVVGWLTAYYMPGKFWDGQNQAASAAIYIGILTINGLILALSWSAFSRIHECITGDEFGAYLMDNDMLGDYVVYIGYVHATQLAAIIVSAAGLVALLYEIPLIYQRVAFAAVLAVSIYAIKQAGNSVTIMHDLIWQKAIFDRNKPKKGHEKVVRIRAE